MATSTIKYLPSIIEQGTSNGWHYKKYSNGALEADRAWNLGQYTINATEVSPIMVGGYITSTLPSMAISGDLEITLMGNTVNSPCFLERSSKTQWRIAKASTGNVTLQGLTVSERTIGARWK